MVRDSDVGGYKQSYAVVSSLISGYFLLVKGTATAEIYTRKIVGSVRCV